MNKKQEIFPKKKQKGKITNKEYREMFVTTDRTALRDLIVICEKGIFQKVGKTGRKTEYIIYRQKHDINPTQTRQLSHKRPRGYKKEVVNCAKGAPKGQKLY